MYQIFTRNFGGVQTPKTLPSYGHDLNRHARPLSWSQGEIGKQVSFFFLPSWRSCCCDDAVTSSVTSVSLFLLSSSVPKERLRLSFITRFSSLHFWTHIVIAMHTYLLITRQTGGTAAVTLTFDLDCWDVKWVRYLESRDPEIEICVIKILRRHFQSHSLCCSLTFLGFLPVWSAMKPIRQKLEYRLLTWRFPTRWSPVTVRSFHYAYGNSNCDLLHITKIQRSQLAFWHWIAYNVLLCTVPLRNYSLTLTCNTGRGCILQYLINIFSVQFDLQLLLSEF